MATRIGLKIAGTSTAVDGTSVRRVDVYTTDYTSEAAALLDANLPKIGNVHPSFPGVYVDSISFSPTEDGRFDISVNYSNDGSFKLLENSKSTAEEGPRLQFGIKQVTVKIPAFALVSKSLSQPGQAPVSVKVWEPIDLSYEENRAMVSYRVVVPSLNLADINVMSEEIHKIHTLGGVRFEFQPWSQTPHNKEKDEITYFWIRDQGTTDPRTLAQWNQAQAARISIPPAIPPVNVPPFIIRYPYTNITAIPNADPFGSGSNPPAPEYFTIPYAVENPNGWMNLPGLA